MSTAPEFSQAWLHSVLAEFSCQTGTLHRTDNSGEFLELIIHAGVPESLLPKISRIPFGKGIAGGAAERRAPVTLCNLQQDLGGVAKPDARQTGVSGSIAVPILSADSTRELGTLGIGMHEPHDFSDEETARLQGIAAEIAKVWQRENPEI